MMRGHSQRERPRAPRRHCRTRGRHPGAGVLTFLLTLLLFWPAARLPAQTTTPREVPSENKSGKFDPAGWGNLVARKPLQLVVSNQDDRAAVANDPVGTTVGEYTWSETDLYLGGSPLPLGFGRYFGSFAGASAFFQGFYGRTDSPMGANWVHNLMIYVSKTGTSNLALHFYQVYTVGFRKTANAWSMTPAPAKYRGTAFQLVEEGTRLKLMDPETEMICLFDNLPGIQPVAAIQDRNGNTHTLTYNPDGTLARVADGLGRALDFAYEASGGKPRLVKVTDPSGRSIEFSYSGAQQAAFTDARGKQTRYQYNTDSRLEAATRPLGNAVVRNTYGADLRVASQADGLGNTTRFAYTSSGGAGVTTMTDPLGNTTVHTFNILKRLTRYTDAAGKSSSFEYDAQNRRTVTADRLGDRSALTYDAASGKVASRTDNEGKSWKYSYTAQAQEGFTFYDLTRIDYPDATSQQYSYDSRGNIIRRVDRGGKTWSYSYNSRGQVLTATNPAGGVTSYSYNGDRTTASVRDGAGNATTFGYDATQL
ncbi:MAG: RHS repeat protein [Acidobacteria bacterium]|nr:RHS repeat protein [Acidobacteriota bacterium]